MTLTAALAAAAAALGVVALGVVALSALEAVWLLPARGIVSTFARARAQVGMRAGTVDSVVALAGMSAALVAPAVAAALTALASTYASLLPLAAGALLLTVPAPVFLIVGGGHDERSRLALHDALLVATRQGIALAAVLVACLAPAVPDGAAAWPGALLVAGAALSASVVLVRGRHKQSPTLLPRFEEQLIGSVHVVWRIAERAVVVVVAALAAVAVVPVAGAVVPAAVVPVAAIGVGVGVGVFAVGLARVFGPRQSEGFAGPLSLLVVVVMAVAFLRLVGGPAAL